MAAEAGEPWRGLAVVRSESVLAAAATSVSIEDVHPRDTDGDQATWEGVGAWTATLRAEYHNAGTHANARRIEVSMRIPGGAAVGDTWVITNGGADIPDGFVATRTFHFDANPLNELDTDDDRWGTFEIFVQMERDSGLGQWGPGDSRGGGTVPNTHNWARGYFRSRATLVSHSISNASLGGAEPATFAYPDPIFARHTLAEACLESIAPTVAIRDGGADVRSKAAASGVGPTYDVSLSNTSGERVDADFDADDDDLRLALPDVDFGGDDKFVWAAAGHETGWVVTDEDTLDNAGRVTVDPAVTIQALALDLPATTVYNRGETAGGSLEVRNARNEKFTPQGTDRLRSERVADGTIEETVDSVVRDGSDVLQWDITFDTAGNVAPADAVGDAKRLTWDDQQAGVNSPTADSAQIGLLSSLLDAAVHLQLNDNTLDPALSASSRLSSDLGFYSVLITNQRGEGKNGVSVTDHLRDDSDLVSAIDRTDTTGTQNGNAGYLPLATWDSQLPGGGWDHWTDAGTFEGNTFEKARSGAGTFDYTLLSTNPAFVVVPGGGPDNNPLTHARAGEAFQAGVSLVNVTTGKRVVSQNPRVALIRLQDDGANAGFAEYLDADETTWVPLDDPVGVGDTDEVHFFVATETRPNSDLFVKTFSAATTAQWGSDQEDIFVLASIEDSNGVPYGGIYQVTMVGDKNRHDSYVFDGPGFVGFPQR